MANDRLQIFSLYKINEDISFSTILRRASP